MALFLFTKAILEGKAINVFNNGKMKRDFTYIDDIVEGVVRASDKIASPDPQWSSKEHDAASSSAPYRLYNIGNNEPVLLMDFIEAIEEALGTNAKKNFMEMQAGDVPETYADVNDLIRDVGFKPATNIKVGVANFVA